VTKNEEREREQDILRRSIAALNSLNTFVQTQTELNVALRDALKNANQRTDAALRRIEQLERDVALDRAEAIKSEKRIEALLDRVNQLVEFHGIAPIGGARVLSTSPATAYPPLPDEGT